jgi:hypothetical protein
MTDGQHQHRGLDPLGPSTIPHRALRPAAFADAAIFQALRLLRFRIQQLLVAAPAQHEAQGEGQQQTQPQAPRKALVKGPALRKKPCSRKVDKCGTVL